MPHDAATGACSVLVVTHTGELGGAERALLRLIAAADDRVDVSLLTLAHGPLVEEARHAGVGVTVLDGGDVVDTTRGEAASPTRIAANARSTLALARRLRRALRAADPDLVVAHSLKSAVLVGLAARRRRWVWHLHDRLAPDYLSAPVVLALRVLARLGPRRIVANSRATAATAGRLPTGRVIVAYPGIEADAFDRAPRDTGGGPVGILGRISPTKGQWEFVEAARIVAASDPSARFRIIGAPLFRDADYAAQLEQRVERSGIAERIERAGWSDTPPETLERLGVFVHASPTPEPFGQVIVEAMAVGTPVVATDAGGVGEIVDPERSAEEIADGVRLAPYGLLVRPGDVRALAAAIMHVRNDRGKADARARAARARARERFTIDRTWRAVSRVWLDVAR